jgi:branched-chain amino acid transport system ATP-binding protein
MPSEALLDVRDLRAGYGETEVLRGVDLTIAPGEIVAVLGSNGVGKSTLNRALSGIVRARAGAIKFEGHDVAHEKPQAIVARGLIHVPEGRRVFPNLSVRENLDLGSYRRGAASRTQNRERVFKIFPRLPPILVEELFALIERINADGVSILLVEQNVVQSLELADRAYILAEGKFVMSGSAKDIGANPELKRAYLGM